jgi:3-keto-5-aminohexanoate cleavage enzyme
MLGTMVSLRLRMSSHDAHYAGELVDGARMLALFGDLATELLIRLDGDEGLFRAYDAVEFLAPVYAGDYIEATAELTRIGASSRSMRFEARKVIGNVRATGRPASEANVLAESVVVCRATGTCVTPKELQRLPRVEVPELILTAAIVGAEITRQQTPHLPITAREIADEAARCRDAGAAVIHLHVRNDDGTPTQSRERFAEAISAIRAKTDCVIQTSTGGAVGMSIDERAQPLLCKPEMATLNCGSINFGEDVFVNTRPEIRDLAKRLKDAGSVPELECYDVGHVEEALALVREGALGAPRSLLPAGASWAIAAVGRHQQPMTELAIRSGGHARVGIEDNIYLSKGVLSEGSAPLVARAAAYARTVGREPVAPTRARALLGLPAR